MEERGPDCGVGCRLTFVLLCLVASFASCLVSITRCKDGEWLCGIGAIVGFLACLALSAISFDWAARRDGSHAPTADRLILRGRSLEEGRGGGGIQ